MSQYPNYQVGPGLRNVGSYQVSGHPFVTGSTLATMEEVKVEFPFVSRSLTLIASGSNASVRVHFNSTGSTARIVDGGHYISLSAEKDAMTIDVKCKEVYVSCINGGGDVGYQLFASLTNIPTSSMYELTGAGLTD